MPLDTYEDFCNFIQHNGDAEVGTTWLRGVNQSLLRAARPARADSRPEALTKDGARQAYYKLVTNLTKE